MAVKRSTSDLNLLRKEAQKRAFKDIPLSLCNLHTCAIELSYKHNIILVAVRYGYISAVLNVTSISRGYECDIANI